MKPRTLIELGRILERVDASTAAAQQHVVSARVHIRVAAIVAELRAARS